MCARPNTEKHGSAIQFLDHALMAAAMAVGQEARHCCGLHDIKKLVGICWGTCCSRVVTDRVCQPETVSSSGSMGVMYGVSCKGVLLPMCIPVTSISLPLVLRLIHHYQHSTVLWCVPFSQRCAAIDSVLAVCHNIERKEHQQSSQPQPALGLCKLLLGL
jgi:hypothetical protein